MDETKQIIKEFYEKLPPKMKEWVVSQISKNDAEEIAKRNGLDESKTKLLENEIFLVSIGAEGVSSFKPKLISEVGLNYQQASKISSEVETKIFGPVIGMLVEMEKEIGEEIEDEVDKEVSEQQPAPVELKTFSPPVPQPTPPDHLLQSHEMIKEPHLHSQTVMPEMEKDNKSAPKNSFFSKIHPGPSVRPNVIREEQIPVPNPPPAPTPISTPTTDRPTQQTPPQNKFSSIVDQKLSRLVRTERDDTQIRNEVEKSRQEKYGANDPYREPIK